MLKNIFDYIENNKQKYLDLWIDICNIESISGDIDALNKVADKVACFASELGLTVNRIPFENCGDFLIIDTLPNAEKGVSFHAHMDTVHKKGAFGYPPVSYEDDILRGPGVIDCKGGIPIALLAMKALAENGFGRNNRLVLNSDEEISNSLGGERGISVIKDAVSGYSAAFNCEVGRNGEVVVSRKGILRYSFEIFGKAAHSGIDYFNGASAIREAANKILMLESLSKPGGITYNCGIINGGTLSNIVPDYCRFVLDVRVRDLVEMDYAKEQVKAVADKLFVEGTETKLTIVSCRLPMIRNEATEKLFNHFKAVSEKYGFGTLSPVESGGGSDSAYTQQAGVPSICAVGATGDYCHTGDEFAYISSLEMRSKQLAAATVELFK